jgi:hypothetical protein
MKNSNIFISALTLFMVMSCSGPVKNEANQSSNVLVQEQDQQQDNAINGETSPAVPVEESNQSLAEQGEAQVMMNPPHGQPFHRCDIPVGSPLPTNSPQQATTNQATASEPAPAPAAASPATATVDKSMIPTLENVNRLNTTPGRQSTTASSTPPTGTPPRNNPPHGQPWHRCDIPVGSPLPVN